MTAVYQKAQYSGGGDAIIGDVESDLVDAVGVAMRSPMRWSSRRSTATFLDELATGLDPVGRRQTVPSPGSPFGAQSTHHTAGWPLALPLPTWRDTHQHQENQKHR
ncbi:MAG: hypothetical protein FWG25_05020 [Promicromonosporaceae bacterium]|nr:hypothetical protein [Promicromonosporaceae bacterium]